MQNLSAPFIFQEECRMKIEYVLFPSVFSKLLIRVSEGHFQCVHMILFSEPTKIGSLKMDRVNGPLQCVNLWQVLDLEVLNLEVTEDSKSSAPTNFGVSNNF